MGKNKPALGIGNKKHFVQRPGTCHTSPARVKLWRRRAEAVALREQNLTYREIGRRMNCRPQLAHELVVGALKEMAPIEQKETVRSMELNRLEKLMQTYFPAAQKGDVASAKVYLKVAAEHSKLAGLYPTDNNAQSVHLNVGGSAEELGIQVKFIPSPYEQRPDGSTWRDGVMVEPPYDWPKLIEARPLPPPQYDTQPPASTTPNVVPLRSDFSKTKPEFPFVSAFEKPPGPRGWMK